MQTALPDSTGQCFIRCQWHWDIPSRSSCTCLCKTCREADDRDGADTVTLAIAKHRNHLDHHPTTACSCCVKGAEQWITFFDWGWSGKSMTQRPWRFQRVAWSPWIWQSFLGEVSLPLEECKIGWWDVEDDSVLFLDPVGNYSRGEWKTLHYQKLQSP